MYPGKGTVVLIRPAQTFYERIKLAAGWKSREPASLLQVAMRERDAEGESRFCFRGKHQPEQTDSIIRYINMDSARRERMFLSLPVSYADDEALVAAIQSRRVTAAMLQFRDTDWKPWWATPTSDVAGLGLSLIRNSLGLSHFNSGQHIVELRYPTTFDQSRLVRPAAVDVGNGSVFRSVVAGQIVEDGWGRTIELQSGTYQDGLSEAIHPRPPTPLRGFDLRVAGKLDSLVKSLCRSN